MRYPRTLCSIQVNNPGGGSGSGTVSTDGVTIQGDGSVGNPIAIKQVETAARLTGAGTVASPLDLTGNPVTAFCWLVNNGGSIAAAQNQTRVFGFPLPYNLTFSNIGVRVATSDNANNYDIGIYNQAGTRVAHIGAQTLPSTGELSFAVVGAPITLTPGLYLFAFTGAAAIAALGHDQGAYSLIFSSQNYAVTSGGALPSTVTAFTPAIGVNSYAFILT